MGKNTKVFKSNRKSLNSEKNKMVSAITSYMEEHNVGVLSLLKAGTDSVYTVTEDEMFRVGAIVIPKDPHGERWIGVIDRADILNNNTLSFIRNEETQTIEWLDNEVSDNNFTTPDWYNYVQCIDDTCMFPLDTYFQISEAVEEAIPD